MMISLENLYFLGGGAALGLLAGILICLILGRAGFSFFSRHLKAVSGQALIDNSDRFINLAEKYFAGFADHANREAAARGDAVLQSIDRYDRHLGMMEHERDKAFGAIYSHLAQMSKAQAQLQAETGNLVKALRLPHVRGRWGELTLRRVAELSGMAEHCDFAEQLAAGSGKGSLRPDMVVMLPQNRKIIIDAKVPLSAYLDALEAESEDDRKKHLADHARQVMTHINVLASRGYEREIGMTPEFTVLFIPGENYFSAALSEKPDLLERGMDKGVILATPATLVALLKAVAYSWKQQKGYENAEKIRHLGVELYRRLCTMAENMNRLGRDIQKCATTFNRTAGAMETRVMASARKFEALGITSDRPPDIGKIEDEHLFLKSIEENRTGNEDT